MKVWKIVEEADTFASIQPKGKIDWIDFSSNFDGTPIKKNIEFPEFELNNSGNRKIGIFPHLTPGVLIVSSKGFELLKDNQNEIEMFKVVIDTETYYIGNVINLIACLDYANSSIKTYPNSKKILRIKKFSFFEDQLTDVSIFKIPEMNTSMIFVTDKFKKMYDMGGYEGLKFVEVY